MMIDMTAGETALLKKILDSYLSELRLEIAATKHGTESLHAEEELIKTLQKNKIRLNAIGNIDRLPESNRKALQRTMERSCCSNNKHSTRSR